MATTCHMVVVRCPKTKVTSLGHFDGHGTAQGINDLVNDTIKEAQREDEDGNRNCFELDLHIIGGFDDDRKLSEKLSLELVKEFNGFKTNTDLTVKFNLKTFCATALNTTERSVIVAESYTTSLGTPGGFVGDVTFEAPHIYGILVNVSTGDICRATFTDEAKHPVPDLRGARSMSGCRKMPAVYRPRENCFVIEPFTSKPWPGIERWLHQTDDNIRWNLSTSPEAEPKNFEAHMRGILQFMHRNPDPMQSIFTENKPLLFDPIISACGLEWVQRK